MFDDIRNSASNEVPLPEERITNAEIEVSDTPIMSEGGTVVIEAPTTSESEMSPPVQIERVEKVAGRARAAPFWCSTSRSQR